MRYGPITAGQARQILRRAASKGLSGMSKVNSSLTRKQAYDIFLGSIEGKPADEQVYSMIGRNIQREFGKL